MTNFRTFTENELQLLEIGSKYSSPEDFKAKNLPKFLLVKKNLLMSVLFPMHTCIMPSSFKAHTENKKQGLVFLYHKDTLVYIIKCPKDYEITLATLGKKYNHNMYKFYSIKNLADMEVLYSYLVQHMKPSFNEEVHHEALSFKIKDVFTMLGRPKLVKTPNALRK